MTSKSALALLLALAAAVATLAAGTARADVQTPIATASPTAFDLLPVVGFEAQAPYKLPRLVDTAGNRVGQEVHGMALSHDEALLLAFRAELNETPTTTTRQTTTPRHEEEK